MGRNSAWRGDERSDPIHEDRIESWNIQKCVAILRNPGSSYWRRRRAAEKLYRHFIGPLTRYYENLFPEAVAKAKALDILATALTKDLKQYGEWDSGTFANWLFMKAKLTAYSQLGRIDQKVTVYLEDLIGLEREPGKRPLSLVLEDDDFEEFLESCGLDDKARIVLFLALQYGLRPKDISSVLGIEEKEATSILHQAQRKVLAMIIDGAGLAVIEQQVVTGLARKKRPKTEIERTLGLERGELEAVLTSAKPKIADYIVHYS